MSSPIASNENSLEPQQVILSGAKPSLLTGKRKRTAAVALSESDALKYHRDNAWPEFGSLLTMIGGEKMLAVLAGAPATQPDVMVSARDFRKSRITNYQKRTTMNGITQVEVANVVPDGVERKVDGVLICNRNASAVSVSLWITGTLTTYILDTYSIPSKAVATITPQGISVSALTRHDQLAELTDDDHTQYALLAGRSGGQTLNGSTVASEDLTLKGTAHATPGRVKIQRPQIQDAAANPSAAGDVWFNSTVWKFWDTALRKVAPFKDEVPSTASLPIYISANEQWEALTLATGKAPIHRGGAVGAYYPTQVLSKSSNYALVHDDYAATVLCTAALTVTLPSPATVGSGWWCCIKKTVSSASTVTVARNASETIDGRSASDVLTVQYAEAAYITDGANWYVLWAHDELNFTGASVTPGTSTQYKDIASGTIQPGTWSMSGVMFLSIGTMTITGSCAAALSEHSNNTTTDHVVGDNVNALPFNTTGANGSATISDWVKTISSASPRYWKAVATYSAVGTGAFSGRLTARRIR